MLDEEMILNRIKSMSTEELSNIMKKALEDSNIPYEEGYGEIIFNGFPIECYNRNIRRYLND